MDLYFPSFLYYRKNVISRLLNQKHYSVADFGISVSLLISTNDLRSFEDLRLMNSLKNLEGITGQKPALLYSKSRYVGTVKRSLSLIKLNVVRGRTDYFLEELSLFLFPYLQKRFGRTRSASIRDGKFTFFCKDFQFFYAYLNAPLSNGFRVSITSSTFYSWLFIDLLQLYKFNFLK